MLVMPENRFSHDRGVNSGYVYSRGGGVGGEHMEKRHVHWKESDDAVM